MKNSYGEVLELMLCLARLAAVLEFPHNFITSLHRQWCCKPHAAAGSSGLLFSLNYLGVVVADALTACSGLSQRL